MVKSSKKSSRVTIHSTATCVYYLLATNTETENVLHGNPPFLNNPSFPIIFLLFSIIRQNLTLPEDIPWSERSDSFHSLNQINRTYCNVTYLTLILALSSLWNTDKYWEEEQHDRLSKCMKWPQIALKSDSETLQNKTFLNVVWALQRQNNCVVKVQNIYLACYHLLLTDRSGDKTSFFMTCEKRKIYVFKENTTVQWLILETNILWWKTLKVKNQTAILNFEKISRKYNNC